MSASKTVSLEAAPEDSSSDIEAVATEMENILAVLGGEWEVADELAGREVELAVGATTPTRNEGEIRLSDPEAYKDMVRSGFPEAPVRRRALSFEGPYHEMFEEAGHYISDQFSDRQHETFEDIVAEEFIGGLAIETFDRDIIPWELNHIQRNLQTVNEMNSDREVAYVERNLDHYADTLRQYEKTLGDVESDADLQKLFNDAANKKDSELEEVPSMQEDFSYRREQEKTPKPYSEWFVDEVVFGFLNPLEEYRQGSASYRDAVDASGELIGQAEEKIDEYRSSGPAQDRERKKVGDSVADRGYFAGRAIASRKHDRVEPEEVVRMDNEEIYGMFSDEALEVDSRLRKAYSIP